MAHTKTIITLPSAPHIGDTYKFTCSDNETIIIRASPNTNDKTKWVLIRENLLLRLYKRIIFEIKDSFPFIFN